MRIEMTVEGETHAVDLERDLAISGPPEAERQSICAKIAFWGAVWAGAIEERERCDIAYRNWRGQMLTSQMGTGDKGKDPAEWKAVAVMESTPNFRALKDQMAEAEGNVAKARVLFEAYSRKGDILARMIGREHAEEYGSRGVGVVVEEPEETEGEKVRKMEAALAHRRERKGEEE